MGNEEKAQQGTPASASTKPEVTPPLKRNVLDTGITQSLIWKKIPLFKKVQKSVISSSSKNSNIVCWFLTGRVA